MTPPILFVSRNLPPLIGGMERLNSHVYSSLAKSYQVSVCGPQGCNEYLPGVFHCNSLPVSPLWFFLLRAQVATLKLALNTKPAIIYSGSGLSAPAALVASKAVGAKSICFLHGLDLVAPSKIYQSLFLPAIRRFDRLLVNSSYTKSLAINSGVPLDAISIINPGVTIPNVSVQAEAQRDFVGKYDLHGKKILLSVGRVTERKGLVPFVRNCLPKIVCNVPEVLFVIAGQEPLYALRHKEGVVAELEATVKELKLESHVKLIGYVDEPTLDGAFFASSVMVFPVIQLPGDVEGFGMVAVEAAAHGVPTVAYSVGGIVDSVADGITGKLIRSGDNDGFADAVIGYLDGPNQTSMSNLCRDYASKFAWDIFESKVKKEFENLID